MQHRAIPVLITILLLAGCATERQERAATTGAIVGATAGAVIGSQSDNTAEGAVIGGVIGGLAGAVLADDSNDVYASPPRYHRGCGQGQRYFNDARKARDPHRRVELLRRGLHYCPNNPAAHNDLGVALVIIGNRREAREHFDHALRLDRDYLPARRNIEHMERKQRNMRPEFHDRGRHEGDYRRWHEGDYRRYENSGRGKERGYDKRDKRRDERRYEDRRNERRDRDNDRRDNRYDD